MQDQMQPMDGQGALPHGEVDREGAMARADLYKCANYSLKLFKKMSDDEQLESWVQAKITKAADYIASVYHYLEYEMKFSEYGKQLDQSEMYSEGQKAALKNKLMEAKEKMKELKKKQAQKIKPKKDKEVDENLTVVPNPSGAKSADDAKKLGAAMPAKAGEKDPISEETSSTGGTITREKGKVRHSHNPDRFSDEPHGEVASKVKSRSASEKAGEKAQDKADEKESKAWGKANPGKQHIYKDGKKVNEASKPDFTDVDDDDNEKESWTKAEKDKKKAPFKKVKEANDGNLANNAKPYDKVTRGDVVAGRLGKDEEGGKKGVKKEKKVDEAKAKPSAGMTKKEKSATVKDAKAGKDIGKPGKNFDKTAKAAGGGEKGKKIAAAAMWKGEAKKNVKEAIAKAKAKLDDKELDEVQSPFPSRNETDPAKKAANAAVKPGTANPAMPSRNKAPEVVKESVELVRMKTLMTRLNG